MAVRQDKIQLNIEFITDEQRSLAKTNVNIKALNDELRSTLKAGGNASDVMRRIALEGGKLSNLDLSKVSKDQLITLSRSLEYTSSKMGQAAAEAAGLTGTIKRVNDQLATVRQSTRGVADAFEKEQNGGFIGTLKRGQLAAIAFIAAFTGLVSSFRILVTATSLFQKFGSVLTRELGSKSEAQRAIKDITQLADDLKKPADGLLGSYTKLVSRGIRPTTQELTKLVDLAASQGKEVDQLAEALLDAGTLEFERLKEFGIRAKQSGDQVALSFKGQTVEVEKNQGAILKAILGFGDLQGVQGAAADSSDNLGGKVARLTGFFDRLLANLGQGGLGDAIGNIIDNVADLVSTFVDLTDVQADVTTETKKSQIAFNNLIETLKRGNLSADVRSEIIKTLNNDYKEYLPNLITEATSEGELARAKELANRQFEKRIRLLAAEQALTDVARRQIELKIDEIRLENDLSAAIERTKDAANRARDATNSQNFAGTSTARSISGQVAANDLAAQAQEKVNAKQKERNALEAEFQRILADAIVAGVDTDKAINGKSSSLNSGGGPGGKEKTLSERLKEIDESSNLQRELAAKERITSTANDEVSEKAYQVRLSAIRKEDFDNQLLAYSAFGQQRLAAAQSLRNEILQLEKRQAEAPGLVRPGLDTLEGNQDNNITSVDRRDVDAQLEALEKEEARQAKIIQEARNRRLLGVEQFGMAKLALQRNVLAQEIEILRTGNTAEVTLANEKKNDLAAIDQQIFDQRKSLAEREIAFRQKLEETKRALQEDGLDAVDSFLARDESSRKKNAGIIKGFEIGRAVVAGLQEVQQIKLAAAAQAAINPLLAPLIIADSTRRSIGSVIRTGVTVGKIASQKFDRGGLPKFGTFGGRSHSRGGNRGVFEDGTQLEVERNETFAILNKNATGALARLSNVNVATGGVPFFARGGVVSSPSTTPVIGPGTAAATVGGGVDAGALTAQMEMLTSVAASLQNIKASVVLTEIEAAQGDLNAARAAAEV